MILDRQCGISVVYLKKYREQISGSTLIIVYATLEKTDHQWVSAFSPIKWGYDLKQRY